MSAEYEDPMYMVPDDITGDNFERLYGQTQADQVTYELLWSQNISATNMMTGNLTNATLSPSLPREMTFNSDNVVSIITYSCMFAIAAVGNLTVFITLFRTRRRKSRVNTFIMNLAIADLIVAFVMLPLETAWHITVAWLAGDVACRVLMFCRAFGFYLSSFVLVTISLDRYFSILHPLSIQDADRRGKLLLIFAWTLSAAASLPQSVIFHVERHPLHPWFAQCVTFNFFPTPTHELAYNMFNAVAVYLLPLVIISTSYGAILRTISRNAKKTSRGECFLRTMSRGQKPSTISLLRCSTASRIGKAKFRTLKMTLVIVSAFFICWTPYFFMSAMWWFLPQSARRVDSKVQRGLFMFAVSNSCVNPIVYGMFTTVFRREAYKWRVWFRTRLSTIGL